MKFVQTFVLLASVATAAPLLGVGGLLGPAAPLVGSAAGIVGKTPVVGAVVSKAGGLANGLLRGVLPGGVVRRDDSSGLDAVEPLNEADPATLLKGAGPAGGLVPGGFVPGGAAPAGDLLRDGLAEVHKVEDLLKDTSATVVVQGLPVPKVGGLTK